MLSSAINPESSEKQSQTIRELVCNSRDAVVLITGQVTLSDNSGNVSIIATRGNGFFIKGHYIICPASLVLISPDLLATNSRIPAFPNNDSLIRVSRILIDVSNVNGSSHSYNYDAEIIGIDGAGNIAILRIITNSEWNNANPLIRTCHKFLQWGKSRSSCPGDSVMLIGDTPSTLMDTLLPSDVKKYGLLLPGAENAVSFGTISDNRYVFPGGYVSGELLLLSNIIAKGEQQGLPIITMDGAVIGMIIHIHNSSSNNIGLSEFFMRRPVKSIIKTYQDGSISTRYRGFITPVSDPIGDYYRFDKSWLGIAGILMGAQDYNTDIVDLIRIPSSDTLGCKEIIGYRVLAVAGIIGTTGLFTPGNVPDNFLIPQMKQSPLYNIIIPGDIITHINDCPLGDRKGQISPSLVMWRVQPGNTVKIMYKKQIERFQYNHEITVVTESYHQLLDFPFYSKFDIPFQNMLPTLL